MKPWSKSEIVFTFYSKGACGYKEGYNNKHYSCIGQRCSCCNCKNTQYMTTSCERDVEEEEVQEDNTVRKDWILVLQNSKRRTPVICRGEQQEDYK